MDNWLLQLVTHTHPKTRLLKCYTIKLNMKISWFINLIVILNQPLWAKKDIIQLAPHVQRSTSNCMIIYYSKIWMWMCGVQYIISQNICTEIVPNQLYIALTAASLSHIAKKLRRTDSVCIISINNIPSFHKYLGTLVSICVKKHETRPKCIAGFIPN